jgi:hypothetical protein
MRTPLLAPELVEDDVASSRPVKSASHLAQLLVFASIASAPTESAALWNCSTAGLIVGRRLGAYNAGITPCC